MDPTILFPNGSIFGIGQWTRRTIAYAGGGVGMFTKLAFVAIGTLGFGESGFVGTELVVDHLPYHLVVLHGC